MKNIYLVAVLLLLLTCTSPKYRYISKINSSPTISKIVGLSSSAFATQKANTITITDIKTGKTQTFQTTTEKAQIQSTADQQILFKSNKGIVQMRQNSGDAIVNINYQSLDRSGTMGIWKNKAIIPPFNKHKLIILQNIDDGSFESVAYAEQINENVVGSSGVTTSAEDTTKLNYYFVSGGFCNSTSTYLSLFKGSDKIVNEVYKIPLNVCNFGRVNQQWQLDTFTNPLTPRHLITFAPDKNAPKIFTTHVVSQIGTTFTKRFQFESQRLIGANIVNYGTIFTADNILCRVVKYTIDNNPFKRITSLFPFSPSYISNSPAQNYVIALFPDNTDNKLGIVYSIQNNGNIIEHCQIIDQRGFTYKKAIFINEDAILMLDNTVQAKLSLFNRITVNISDLIQNVQDFVITSDKVVFSLENRQNQQYLAAYTVEGNQLRVMDSLKLNFDIKELLLLEGGQILLNPSKEGDKFQIFSLVESKIVKKDNQLTKSNSLHAEVTIIKSLILFSNQRHDQLQIYTNKFQSVDIPDVLPPNSVFKVTASNKGTIVVAIGDALDHFLTFNVYSYDGIDFKYVGSFPYKTEQNQAQLSHTILLTNKDKLYLAYSKDAKEWLDGFKISTPPQMVYGYLTDPISKQCSDYNWGHFKITAESNQFTVLNISTPAIDKYSINENGLKRLSSTPLLDFTSTDIKIKISHDGSALLVYGINKKQMYAVQARKYSDPSVKFYYQQFSEASGKEVLEDFNLVGVKSINLFGVSKEQSFIKIQVQTESKQSIPIKGLFDEITSFSVCPKCSLLAVTGINNAVASTSIAVVNPTSPSNPKWKDTECSISVIQQKALIALSPSGLLLAWLCKNNSLIVYDMKAEQTKFSSNKINVDKLDFIDETHILINQNNKIVILDITQVPKVTSEIKANYQPSISINYEANSYVSSTDQNSLILYNIKQQKQQQLKFKDKIENAISISYSPTGQLYALTISEVYVFSEAACPQYQAIDYEGYCQCFKNMFLNSQSNCQCLASFQFNLETQSCQCEKGLYESANSVCQDCSFMCSTCQEDGLFDCQNFGAWFYVFVIGIPLILAGIVVAIVFKIRKNKKNVTSDSEQQSKQASQNLIPQNQKEKKITKSKKDSDED